MKMLLWQTWSRTLVGVKGDQGSLSPLWLQHTPSFSLAQSNHCPRLNKWMISKGDALHKKAVVDSQIHLQPQVTKIIGSLENSNMQQTNTGNPASSSGPECSSLPTVTLSWDGRSNRRSQYDIVATLSKTQQIFMHICRNTNQIIDLMILGISEEKRLNNRCPLGPRTCIGIPSKTINNQNSPPWVECVPHFYCLQEELNTFLNDEPRENDFHRGPCPHFFSHCVCQDNPV